ncbi:MAG: ABC transporter permease [Candidatus Verstraetearchaeota archaeon]|nr:ABC transporter permease [Candidatus Verstraetearchaeota archaeon]
MELKLTKSTVRSIYKAVISIALALVVTSVLFIATGANPILAYYYIFVGAFGNLNLTVETLVRTTPILLVSLGLAIAFKCKVWNIGAEGQLYMGAMAGTITAVSLGNSPLTLPASILVAILGGMAWAAVPALMKTKLGINEVITTFLMNYVAIYFVQWLLSFPFRSPDTLFPESAQVPQAAVLPILLPTTRLHLGVVLAIAVALPLVYFLMIKTTFGYKLRAVGENPEAARFGGINVSRTIFLALVLSGALAGIAGLFEVSGIQFRMRGSLSPGYGYTGIVVALLGQNNPIGVFLSSIFLAAIFNGSSTMSRVLNQPQGVVDFIQGVLVIFVLGSEYIMRYLEKKGVFKA